MFVIFLMNRFEQFLKTCFFDCSGKNMRTTTPSIQFKPPRSNDLVLEKNRSRSAQRRLPVNGIESIETTV